MPGLGLPEIQQIPWGSVFLESSLPLCLKKLRLMVPFFLVTFSRSFFFPPTHTPTLTHTQELKLIPSDYAISPCSLFLSTTNSQVTSPYSLMFLVCGLLAPTLLLVKFFFVTSLSGRYSHTRKATHLKMDNITAFIIFTELHNHRHSLILEHIHHPQKKSCIHQQSNTLPQP